MESVLSVVQSPVFIGILIFLGMASIIRVMVSRDPSLKRNHGGDRRCTKGKMPQIPFYDSDGVQVTENRRMQVDRRRTRLLATQQEMGQDNILN